MKILEIIPPPRVEKLIRCEFTEAEIVVITFALRDIVRIIRNEPKINPCGAGPNFVDHRAVEAAGRDLWTALYPVGDPGLCIQDRLSEFFPHADIRGDRQ